MENKIQLNDQILRTIKEYFENFKNNFILEIKKNLFINSNLKNKIVKNNYLRKEYQLQKSVYINKAYQINTLNNNFQKLSSEKLNMDLKLNLKNKENKYRKLNLLKYEVRKN